MWLHDLKRDLEIIYSVGQDGGLDRGGMAGVQGLGFSTYSGRAKLTRLRVDWMMGGEKGGGLYISP